MRILVTNDDGMAAPGLKVAEDAAAALAGPDGEVWVVAPAFEQSGVSHAISFTSPIKVEKLDARRFACAGTPADCVILALHAFMANTPPDLVLSGVNRGHNIAEDAVYSGTVGGAIEGALQRIPAIALSQYYGRHLVGSYVETENGPVPYDMFEPARAHVLDACRTVLAAPWPPDVFYNVNFPPTRASEVKGMRFAQQGRRTRGAFTAGERTSPGGRPYFWLEHRLDNTSAEPDADATLCAQGWVTMTPMRADYTDVATLAALRSGESGGDA